MKNDIKDGKMEYILVAYIYAGMMAKGDSVALTKIDTFPTQQSCIDAGEMMKPFVSGSTKNYLYKCLPKPKGN